MIENITLEEALKLFELPRTVGRYNDVDVIAMRGRFGPLLKYGDKNFSLPRGKNPVTVSLEECETIIEEGLNKAPANAVLASFEASDIQVINGRYGPYIKHAGANFRIPKDTDVTALTEADCQSIINNTKSTSKTNRRFKKT